MLKLIFLIVLAYFAVRAIIRLFAAAFYDEINARNANRQFERPAPGPERRPEPPRNVRTPSRYDIEDARWEDVT